MCWTCLWVFIFSNKQIVNILLTVKRISWVNCTVFIFIFSVPFGPSCQITVIDQYSMDKHTFRQQKSSLIVQHLISGLNVFIRTIAPTSRVQVCKLGEDNLLHILYLWHNLASDDLKVISPFCCRFFFLKRNLELAFILAYT